MELGGASGSNVVNTTDTVGVNKDNSKMLNCVQNMQNKNLQAKVKISSPAMAFGYSGPMHLNYIRGNKENSIPKEAHPEWWNNLNQSTMQKQEPKKTIQYYQNVYEGFSEQGSSSSAAYDHGNNDSTSMGLRTSSDRLNLATQLWQRTFHHLHCKARYEFQRKTISTAKAEWTSNGNYILTSDGGRQVILTDVHLLHLTDGEIMVLQQQAVEEINLLNIGINAMVPSGGRKAVFGRSLEHLVAKERKQKPVTCLSHGSSTSNIGSPNNFIRGFPSVIEPIEWIHLQVPKVVQNCIEHIEKYGLKSVGIFMVSISKKRVAHIRGEFDRSGCNSIDPDTNPHIVATMLKKFLRDLPEPLLCKHLYKDFLRSQRICNRHQQMEVFSHLVRLLPTVHRDTLYVLLRFLAKVASCSGDVIGPDGTIHIIGNKMDSKNLATVFAPNILRPSLTNDRYSKSEELDKMLDVIDVIRIMIDHYERLFTVPAELMQDIYAEMSDRFPEQLNYLCEHLYKCDKYRNIASSRFGIDQSVHPQQDQQYKRYQGSDTRTIDSENEWESGHSTSTLDIGHMILHSKTGELDKMLKIIPVNVAITDEDTRITSQGPIYKRQDLILSEFGREDFKN